MTETWRFIKGYEPIYGVSNHGNVMSLCNIMPRILKPRPAGEGYYQVSLRKNGQTFPHYIHTLVLSTFVGPRPKGLECRHLDGDRTNNHADNLAWGTKKENSADSIKHGVHPGIGKFGKHSTNYKHGKLCRDTPIEVKQAYHREYKRNYRKAK